MLIRRSRQLVGACVAATAACNSLVKSPDLAPVPAAAAPGERAIEVDEPASKSFFRLTGSTAPAIEVRVNAPPSATYAALAGAYEDVGLPHNYVDTVTRVVGAMNVPVRGRIGSVYLGSYISCGGGSIAEGAIGEYRVRLTLLSRVTPEGSASLVSTQVFATGERQSAEGEVVRCHSFGRLEAALERALLYTLPAPAR